MKEMALDPDDGMVEVYVSASHRKEFHEQASNDYANSFADDDDIEYTVTLWKEIKLCTIEGIAIQSKGEQPSVNQMIIVNSSNQLPERISTPTL